MSKRIKKDIRLFDLSLVGQSIKESFVKLNPRVMMKNPVMFCVEIGTLIMLFVSIYSFTNSDQGSPLYNVVIFVVLLVTLIFANFAEAIAEARGKAQADSLRKTREETPAKVIADNGIVTTKASSQLKKGDVFICEAGEASPRLTKVRSRENPHQSSVKRAETKALLPVEQKCFQIKSRCWSQLNLAKVFWIR